MQRYNPDELYRLAGVIKPVLTVPDKDTTVVDVLGLYYFAHAGIETLLSNPQLKLSAAAKASATALLHDLSSVIWTDGNKTRGLKITSRCTVGGLHA